jgi:RNA polymerase sigma-70 factor, ECF subfamily
MSDDVRPLGVPRTDGALMARYAAGDALAFDELFERWEHRVFGYFLRRTRSRDRAQDLYQELFLRVHRARDSFDPERPFAPWLFGIAHRLLIDDVRRAHRRNESSLDEERAISNGRVASEDPGEREALIDAFAILSASERYVLLASKRDGLSHSELAGRLDRSTDAVKQLASRASRKLRRALAAEGRGPSAWE